MNAGMKQLVLAVLAAGMVAAAGHALGRASVFSSASYGQAKTVAESSQRLFIVNAYAPWSKTCRRMSKKAWADPALCRWATANAVAVQFNIEQERGLRQKFGIQQVPTIIAFKDGQELDRIVGEHSAQQILEWLQCVRRGERRVEQLRLTADAGREDFQWSWTSARSLVRVGELDDAADHYGWLWDNMLEYAPSRREERFGALAQEMQGLAHQHPPAWTAFEVIRDRSTSTVLQGTANTPQIVDWVHLNWILQDEDATEEWFDSACFDSEQRHLLAAVESHLFRILVVRERWADAGEVLADPVAYIQRVLEKPPVAVDAEQMPEQMRQTVERLHKQQVHHRMSIVYAACLAAGREAEARRIAEILLASRDATVRFQLVRAALSAGSPRDDHVRWMQEAQDSGVQNQALSGELAQALDARDEQSR
jgi:thioredoxin 1